MVSTGSLIQPDEWATSVETNDMSVRPVSENAVYEDPPQEGEPFDYDAEPERFYLRVETSGALPPDSIVQEGVKMLQQKLAGLIHELTEAEGGAAAAGDSYDGPQSPEYTGGDAWQDQGYTTPYGNGGNQSSWGGAVGGATPYGTTPYGNPGQSSWN